MYRAFICRQLGRFYQHNFNNCRNTTAYTVERKTSAKDKIKYLPEAIILPNTKEKVILDFYRNSDYADIYNLMKDVIEEGLTFPVETIKDFEDYFYSHDVFVMRDEKNEKVLGSFQIKPNFPGRSSHIANLGMIIHPDYRRKGVGVLLAKRYLKIARDLGYEGSLFNLVYVTNIASVSGCRKLGFQEVGRIPKAGKLKGLGYVDAIQFYYDLTTLKNEE